MLRLSLGYFPVIARSNGMRIDRVLSFFNFIISCHGKGVGDSSSLIPGIITLRGPVGSLARLAALVPEGGVIE